MYALLQTALQTINQLLTAGIAITAFSLLLYALSFNLRDRVARSFALILLCVVIVSVGEALGSVAGTADQLAFWLRFQWLGIIFLPPAYLHLSDALLATTGQPSRGRRRLAVRLSYWISFGFLLALPFSLLVGPLVQNVQPAAHLRRTGLTWIFTLYYALVMILAWVNFWRAYLHTRTSAGRRRISYLLAGALAPALGSYPYLLFGSSFAVRFPLVFWLIVTAGNLGMSVLLIVMAYSVAFFGVPWPDRVVKRRLFKWLMRGPVTASTVLAVVTVVRRVGESYGGDWKAVSATMALVVMVGLILLFEHLFTLASPMLERLLFQGKDRDDMTLIHNLEGRLLTVDDLRQLLEALLAAACDRLQAPKGFLASLNPANPFQGSGSAAGAGMANEASNIVERVEILVTIGGENPLPKESFPAPLLLNPAGGDLAPPPPFESLFTWGDYWLVPLVDPDHPGTELVGLMGIVRRSPEAGIETASIDDLDSDQLEALEILSERAAQALCDRQRQQQLVSSLQALTSQMDLMQQMRAAAHYDRGVSWVDALAQGGDSENLHPLAPEDSQLVQWVKDALTHYWGGPKLTQSPLLSLKIVQKVQEEQAENPTNALRLILRQAIEQVRPDGERRFTAEWILYNILEMKFLEGRKVREIAMRLAMSEADLYRKQRVAIEAVAEVVASMEAQARQGESGGGERPLTEGVRLTELERH